MPGTGSGVSAEVAFSCESLAPDCRAVIHAIESAHSAGVVEHFADTLSNPCRQFERTTINHRLQCVKDVLREYLANSACAKRRKDVAFERNNHLVTVIRSPAIFRLVPLAATT